MNSGPTVMGSLEVEQYCDAVRDALADLPPDVRDDLLEDLPDHLSEVLAEGEGSLRDRLGEPVAYAQEMRSAAGLEPATALVTGSGARFATLAGRVADAGGQLDLRLGRVVGYPRLMDLLRASRPGWWVLRGWIFAEVLCGIRDRDHWRGFIPKFGGSALLGFGFVLVMIAGSVWLGQRSMRLSGWPRRLARGAGLVIAIWALVALFAGINDTEVIVGPASSLYSTDPGITDIYVYDQNGNPVDGARLFDQNGNPIQLGSGACQNGDPAPGASTYGVDAFGNPTPSPWTYPLCPSDTGPFRSGPGPIESTGAAAVPSGSSGPSTVPTGASTIPSGPTGTPTVPSASSSPGK